MAKGFFTQSAYVLLAKPTSLDAITPLLADFKIAKRIDEVTDPILAGPSLIVAYRPEVNGYVNVDVRDIVWPDHMGDVESEPMLFAAWSMGHYGPYAFPGGYRRAKEQLWSWPEGKQIADGHKAFINIKTSYVFGAEKDARVAPPDYDPLPEMHFVTQIALALLKQAHLDQKELCPPPRRRIRWFPVDGSKPPADMLAPEAKASLGAKLGKLFGRK